MTATLTSPVDLGTVTLTELSKATENYLENEVEVRITDVTRNLNVGGDGTFTVSITNSTADRGVRLHDVTVHLELGSGGSIRMLPPTSPASLETRATGSRSDAELSPNAQVSEMFVFFPNPPAGANVDDDVLDPGESAEFEARYHAQAVGTTDIKAHVHAEILFEDLFPRTNGTTVRKSVTIGN